MEHLPNFINPRTTKQLPARQVPKSQATKDVNIHERQLQGLHLRRRGLGNEHMQQYLRVEGASGETWVSTGPLLPRDGFGRIVTWVRNGIDGHYEECEEPNSCTDEVVDMGSRSERAGWMAGNNNVSPDIGLDEFMNMPQAIEENEAARPVDFGGKAQEDKRRDQTRVMNENRVKLLRAAAKARKSSMKLATRAGHLELKAVLEMSRLEMREILNAHGVAKLLEQGSADHARLQKLEEAMRQQVSLSSLEKAFSPRAGHRQTVNEAGTPIPPVGRHGNGSGRPTMGMPEWDGL